MKDVILEIYDQYFKNSQLITFDKFQVLVNDYLNTKPDLDEETGAMIIANKYSALQYIECKIADLAKYNGKKVKVKGQIIKISEAQTHVASNANFVTITITDSKSIMPLFFWGDKIQETQNFRETDNIEAKGYVTISNTNKKPILKSPSMSLLDEVDIIIKSKTLSDLEKSDIICKTTLRVSGYIEQKKKDDLKLYSYLVSDDTSFCMLKSWRPIAGIDVNKTFDLFNLTKEASSNDTKFSLKYSALSTIKESNLKLPDLSNTYSNSLKNLVEGLMHNLKLTITAKNTLTYTSNDGKTNNSNSYTCVDSEQSECKFVDWTNQSNLEINKEQNFKYVYVTKYNTTYELGLNIFTLINGS